MAELGVSPPTSLYPQPPQGGGALTPSGALDLLSGVIRNTTQMKELNARNAIGQAYQKSIQPDGTFDQPGFNAMIRDNPDAAWMAGEALPHALDIARSQVGNALQQQQATASVLGSLKRDSSDEEVRHFQTVLSRVFKGQNPAVVEAIGDRLKSLKGQARADYIDQLQTLALPPGQAAGLVAAPPGPGNIPQQQTLKERLIGGGNGAGGAPGPGYGGRGGTPQATGPAPGVSEAQTAEATEGQRAAVALQNAANEIPTQRTQLDLMRQDLETAKRVFGPTAGYEKVANQIANRVVGFNPTMSAKEIAALESFDKVGRQIALTQSGQLHATDQTLTTALGANPSTNLSALGNEGIINMLYGNTDALAVKASEWNDARRGMGPDRKVWGPDEHYQWSQKFNKNFDPRVFQFMRMSSEQQGTLLKSIPDKASFEQHLIDAEKRGWITLPPAPRKPGAPKTEGRAPSNFNDRFNAAQ